MADVLPLQLVVIHFVGDFLAQSDWMALNKSKRWDALALHVAAYSFVLGAATYALAETHLAWLVFVLVNSLLHFATDAVTSRVTSRLWFLPQVGQGMRPEWIQVEVKSTRHWFFVAIGFDQVLHYTALFITAGWWLR